MAISDDDIGDSFDVEINAYDGIDILSIAEEELFKTAIRAQNRWQDNLSRGRGAVKARTSTGKRNPSWVNTGEGRDSITIEPQHQGSLEFRVGSDKVQVRVAEVGRSPGEPPPPWTPIAEWANEVGIVSKFYKNEDAAPEDVQDIITGIRFSIAENGIGGFAPGHEAGKREGEGLQTRVDERTTRAVKDAENA